MSRSVSSREFRLHDQDELDWTLPCESNVHSAIYNFTRKMRTSRARLPKKLTFEPGDYV